MFLWPNWCSIIPRFCFKFFSLSFIAFIAFSFLFRVTMYTCNWCNFSDIYSLRSKNNWNFRIILTQIILSTMKFVEKYIDMYQNNLIIL
jgi:hypothetical protein